MLAEREAVVPLYEYRCESCGHRFEVLQKVGEGPAGLRCPGCGTVELEKECSTFAGAVAGGSPGASCSPSRFT
jgi:putative FmdB family regulatory protein